MNGSLPMLFVKSYNVYIYWHISFRFSLPKDVSDTCPGVARVLPCLRLAGHWQGMLRSPDPPRPPPEPGPAILRLWLRLPGQAESVQCIKCPGLPPSSHHLMVNTSVIELSPWYVICDCDDISNVVTLTVTSVTWGPVWVTVRHISVSQYVCTEMLLNTRSVFNNSTRTSKLNIYKRNLRKFYQRFTQSPAPTFAIR